MRFTWDFAKAASNVRKHGVSFEEAGTVFGDPLAAMVQDVTYPERMLLVGESANGRILVTVFTEIADDTIRIISARRATSYERRRYEEGGW